MEHDSSDPHFPVSQAGPQFPGPPPSRATIWRWILKGIRGHRLESKCIGGRRFVTRSAIDAWLIAINACDERTRAVSRSQRERTAQSAVEQLKAKGI